jgi:large subunit ribosomal protein L30
MDVGLSERSVSSLFRLSLPLLLLPDRHYRPSGLPTFNLTHAPHPTHPLRIMRPTFPSFKSGPGLKHRKRLAPHRPVPFAEFALRQPRETVKPLPPRAAPCATAPFYHPFRAQYPFPAVHHVPKRERAALHAAEPPAPATHFRITLRRSPIALPPAAKKTCVALGLTRKDRTVFHPFSPVAAGHILTIKELVEVRNVCWEQMDEEVRRGKGQAPGLHKGDIIRPANEERAAAVFEI